MLQTKRLVIPFFSSHLIVSWQSREAVKMFTPPPPKRKGCDATDMQPAAEATPRKSSRRSGSPSSKLIMQTPRPTPSSSWSFSKDDINDQCEPDQLDHDETLMKTPTKKGNTFLMPFPTPVSASSKSLLKIECCCL